jgi:hypothetical protein
MLVFIGHHPRRDRLGVGIRNGQIGAVGRHGEALHDQALNHHLTHPIGLGPGLQEQCVQGREHAAGKGHLGLDAQMNPAAHEITGMARLHRRQARPSPTVTMAMVRPPPAPSAG